MVKKQYELISHDMNGIKIFDHQNKTLVSITINPKGLQCHHCETSQCLHVDFMLSVPDMAKTVRQKIKAGWNLPDPDR
ncbi:MAG: hypothetical protein FWE56_00270 [Candidatus Bathyarchaeota archaeon]|nr:hypothetical protein [Candidatus Termiticorpusculum sp.]MCL2867876.1 hypothetical protein [Candidatus Termiticorpusculum sp.]